MASGEEHGPRPGNGDLDTQVRGFFDGLDLLPPGVVPVPRWRPADELEASAPTMAWAGVGRKP